MNVGIRYTFPSDCYPRYSYLKTWTDKLLPRFKEKIETNKFDECVCNGYADLQEILAVQQCLQKPTVTVFAKPKNLVPVLGKALVQSMEPFRHDQLISDKLSWTDLITEGAVSSDYDSRILVIIADENEQDISQKLLKLTTSQQESTVIYNPSTRTHRCLLRCDRLPSSDTYPQTLSRDIQSILELKIVKLLEKVACYIETLVPREGQEPDKSFLDDIIDKLEHLEICCVKEALYGKSVKFYPEDIHGRLGGNPEVSVKKRSTSKKKTDKSYKKDKIQESRKTPNDHNIFSEKLKFEQICKLIELIGRRTKCQMIEHLSMKYGIHPMVTTVFLTSDQFYNFDDKYAKWIKKDKIDQLDTVETILSKCVVNISHLIHEIADYIQQKYEQLEVIQRQQFELFGLLRQSNFKVKYRVETKLNSELQDELLQLSEVTGCGTIYGILTIHALSELSPPSKETVKVLLHRYNYHKGYKVHVSSKVLQAGDEIYVENGSGLLAEVLPGNDESTGTSQQANGGTLGCYVIVKQKQSAALKQDSSSSSSKEGDRPESMEYTSGSEYTRKQYDLKSESGNRVEDTESQQNEMLGDDTHIDNGSRVEDTESQQNEMLGDDLQTRDRKGDLCCITCRHCFRDCKQEITVDNKGTFALQTDYFIDSGDKFDIALLKIDNKRKKDCVHKLRKKCEDESIVNSYCPWKILQDSTNLASRSVYKFGCITGYTFGVVASDDYKERHITMASERPKVKGDPSKYMDPTVNVIIIGSDAEDFSKKGDSGSVICDMNIEDHTVTAISILHGCLERNKRWVCAYSALLKQSFEELERAFNIEILCPDFRNSAFMEDPLKLDPNLAEFLPLHAPVGEEAGEPMDAQDVEADQNAIGLRNVNPRTDTLQYKQSGLWSSGAAMDNLPTRQQNINMRQCRQYTKDVKQ